MESLSLLCSYKLFEFEDGYSCYSWISISSFKIEYFVMEIEIILFSVSSSAHVGPPFIFLLFPLPYLLPSAPPTPSLSLGVSLSLRSSPPWCRSPLLPHRHDHRWSKGATLPTFSTPLPASRDQILAGRRSYASPFDLAHDMMSVVELEEHVVPAAKLKELTLRGILRRNPTTSPVRRMWHASPYSLPMLFDDDLAGWAAYMACVRIENPRARAPGEEVIP
jgi:hypothetical protein